MADDIKFVTVLKTVDAGLIDLVTTTLDAEGIAYQHPGKNHAAMIPGFAYFEIELRVPEANADDARALIEELRVREVGAPTPIAFRVRRTYGAIGAVFGAILGIVWINTDFVHASELTRSALLGLSICGSCLLGKALPRDCCSLPTCRARLRPGIAMCPKCGADIRGMISSTRDHFTALEKFSR
jgi:hypothetical protein